jgi:hypothetical protein
MYKITGGGLLKNWPQFVSHRLMFGGETPSHFTNP